MQVIVNIELVFCMIVYIAISSCFFLLLIFINTACKFDCIGNYHGANDLLG